MDHVDAFLNYMKDELAYSPHTVKSYKADLEEWRAFISPDAENFDVCSVTTNDIRAWVAFLGKKGLSSSSIKRKLSSVRTLYNFMIKRHGAQVNPALNVRINRRQKPLPKFIDTKEMALVLEQLDMEATVEHNFESVRDYLIVNMLYQTGIRASELMSLTDERVDISRSELKVLGKRNKERIVPFGSNLKELIETYKGLRPHTNSEQSAFFTDNDGAPMKYNQLYYVVRKALDGNVSSSKRSPHVLRHTFATDMLNRGANLTSVRKLLGHSSLATTQIYTHVSVGELYENYNRAHPHARKHSIEKLTETSK